MTRLLPLQVHDALPTSHLRLAQAIAVAWVVTGQSFSWPPPWLSPLEGAPEWPWRLGFAAASTAACVALVWSRFTRVSAGVLALLITAELFACRTWFAHNRLFVLALLAMVALSSARVTWLPRTQVALVFFAAALDKALAPGWVDGRFVTSFLTELSSFGHMWAPGGHVGGENLLAQWLSTRVGDGRMAGLGVIAFELAVAAGFVLKAQWGAWLNAAFHCGVFALTGGTMGQFFFAGLASSLLLVPEADQPRAAPLVVGVALLASPWMPHLLPAGGLAALALGRVRGCVT
jgi:hypothetical protein